MTPPSSLQEPLPRSLVRRSGGMRKLLRERLWLRVLIGMALGIGVGAALDPDVGLATILESVSIPAEGIALVIGVDRLLDMGRTVASVAGDLAAALVIGARAREAPEAAVFDPTES